jgi:hypothetical protein
MSEYLFKLSSFPCWIWFGSLMFFCGFYTSFICPILLRFWIIPKIENRMHLYLKIDASSYKVLFPAWSMSFELAFYIFFKYIGWTPRGMKKPRIGTYYDVLNKATYDIKTASKQEIVVACISAFFFFSFFIALAVSFITMPKG